MYDDQKSYNNIIKNNSSKITINDTIMTVFEVLWELAMCQRHANWPWQLEKKKLVNLYLADAELL